jgi:hypothetical protein
MLCRVVSDHLVDFCGIANPRFDFRPIPGNSGRRIHVDTGQHRARP